MTASRVLLTLASIVLPIVLFVFSIVGFTSVVSSDRWSPKHADGSSVKCNVPMVEVAGGVRLFGASCDNGKFYLPTALGATDFTKEITETDFVLRGHLAQNMVDGWTVDIDLDDPRAQAVFDELNSRDTE